MSLCFNLLLHTSGDNTGRDSWCSVKCGRGKSGGTGADVGAKGFCCSG